MKKIVCIVLFIAFQNVVVAQSQASFGLTAGYATNGYGGQLSYSHELEINGYFNAHLLISSSELKQEMIPYKNYVISGGYYHYLYKDRDDIFKVALGGGGTLNIENINKGRERLVSGGILDDNSGEVFGGFLGSELQYLITDSLHLLGTYNLFLYANSNLGTSSAYVGIGVKYFMD